MRSLARSAVVLLFLLSGVSPAIAQGGRAEINGTIVDQSQAVLPGVTVTVVNEGTSIERVVVTGPDGRFVVPTLVPGLYTVSVDLAGFQAQTRENVRVSVGQEVAVDFTLGVGGLAEEVTVSAEAPTVEVTTTRVATHISNEEIDNLPSQGRNQLVADAARAGSDPQPRTRRVQRRGVQRERPRPRQQPLSARRDVEPAGPPGRLAWRHDADVARHDVGVPGADAPVRRRVQAVRQASS